MNLIGSLSFIDSIQDFGTSPELNGPQGVAVQDINGTTFVYVAGEADDGIQVLSLGDNGELTPVTSTAQASSFGLNSVSELKTVQVGDEYFLIASAFGSDAINVFRLDDDGEGTDGHLVWVDTYRNFPGTGEPTEGQGVLDYAWKLDTYQTGNKTFLAVSAYFSDAVSVYEMAGNGELTQVDVVTDSDEADFQLNGAAHVAFHDVGGTTYLFASSYSADNGVSVFEVNNNGTLSNVFNLELTSATQFRDFTLMQSDGQTYFVGSDQSGDQIHVYTVADDGSMVFVSNTVNFVNGDYSDLRGIQAVEIAGVPYILATAQRQDTILVMTLDDNGDIQIVETFTSAAELDGAYDVTLKQMGDRVFLLVSAFNADKVSVLEIGGASDAVVGSAEDDKIVGLNGEDDLLGRAGDDYIQGLNGDDVISGQAGRDLLLGGEGDDVMTGGSGVDTLEGGAGADVLVGGRGADVLSYAQSGSVSVNLADGTASGAHATGDIFVGFVDLTGSGSSDTLVGDGEDNRINGLKGNDNILGAGGADDLLGGGGNDTLSGGSGADDLRGGGGRDVLLGGTQNDKLRGEGGNDELVGDQGRDRLFGGGGRDTLDGGSGGDKSTGGGGADVFVFGNGDGNDTITDFAVGTDRLDLSSLNAINSLSEFNANAFTVSGNTLVLIDDDTSITLEGVRESDFSASDFIF